MRRFAIALAIVLGAAVPADYPIFETDFIPPAEHKERREKVRTAMAPGGVAVFFSNPERNRNNDVDFLFRQDSSLLYLSGFNEPDSALVLIPDGIEVNGRTVKEVLFCNVATRMSETWLGYRMEPKGAEAILKIEAALPNTEFANFLNRFPAGSAVRATLPDGPTGQLSKMVEAYRAWEAKTPTQRASLNDTLAKYRVIKSADELRLMRRAISASVDGHVEMMRSAEKGMNEYDLGAIFHYVIGRRGCEYVGYPNIVGSGPNACTLHYTANRRKVTGDDLICVDAGGEYHGYTADVTRTWPIDGTFNPEQRAIYEIVREAQDAGIRECVSGKPFSSTDRAARAVIAKGLVKLGIIKKENEAGMYFMHGTSHYLGLDVHDSNGSNVLAPNMVLTVEPGIYIKEGSPCDKKWWNIGVRIEDDILVTSGAPVNLSAKAPRTIPEIEKLMAQPGIGNVLFGADKQ